MEPQINRKSDIYCAQEYKILIYARTYCVACEA